MVIQQRLVTIDEFEEFIARSENDDRLFELVNGEIVEKVPTEEHQIVASNAYDALQGFVKPRNLGRVLFEVRRRVPGDEHNARLPDVEFTTAARLLPVVRKGAVPQIPDLAVEIKSPSNNNIQLREKALYYLKNGVRLVWLILPAKSQVEVYTEDDILILGIDDTLDGGDVLPGFTLAVRDLFTE